MATEDKSPAGAQQHAANDETAPHIQEKEGVPEAAEVENGDSEALKEGHLPSNLAPIEALGIENWQELEKKLVRRLDLTLMPCLWVLYMFNYLDRASIA